ETIDQMDRNAWDLYHNCFSKGLVLEGELLSQTIPADYEANLILLQFINKHDYDNFLSQLISIDRSGEKFSLSNTTLKTFVTWENFEKEVFNSSKELSAAGKEFQDFYMKLKKNGYEPTAFIFNYVQNTWKMKS